MENEDDISEMMSLKKLVIHAIEETNDPEFLDFIYKLIEYHHKE